MAATLQEVNEWIAIGKSHGAEVLISVCDTYDHEDYPVYCAADEVDERKKLYTSANMQRINEIIDLRAV